MRQFDLRTFIARLNLTEGHLYLLERINPDSGFFLFDGKVSFARKSSLSRNNAVSTELLDFQPGLEIEAIENDASFESGPYDFLLLKNSSDQELVDSFIEIVTMYEKQPTMPFGDFIYSLIDLFQLPKQQAELNCIGLYGELAFMKQAWLRVNKDLSPFWHLSGVYSKYDYSSKKTNLEIKTTPKETNDLLIKHSQVFNGESNYIGVVKISASEGTGESLSDLVSFFRHSSPFTENIRFQLMLRKELAKKIGRDTYCQKFIVRDIVCFSVNDLPTLENIPSCISEISYKYDFDTRLGMSMTDFLIRFN